jgi:midasin
MRKVIPYIASNFRKDKIWLRRTKPHSRDYQVLLALDDSESIALAVRIEKISSITHTKM